jgi:superfamily I DNA/RNA helicase
VLWRVFEHVRSQLAARGWLTEAMLQARLSARVVDMKRPPFEFVVVDEAQDLSVAQLKLLTALGNHTTQSLFFAGDLGQRIFQLPFSWRTIGIDVRGRATALKVNYRTSHQIRAQADRLLGDEVVDVDGNVESRRGTVSVFNGAEPTILRCNDAQQEANQVSAWLRARLADGVAPHEIGVFVRSAGQLERATTTCQLAGIGAAVMQDRVMSAGAEATVSTMYLAKGLEFRAVAVMACDDDVVPLRERQEGVGDEADLDEVYATERHLLYVACTRARDFLCVSGVNPVSEFIDDVA